MSTNDNDEHDSGTAVALAAIGGGAALLWLLFRGRGKGWGIGSRSGSNEGTPSSGAPRRLAVRTRSGDHIEVDGIGTDLATTLALARDVGSVVLHATGDARAGWVSKVFYTLADAGVEVWTGSGIDRPPVRFAENDQPDRTDNPQRHRTPAVNSSAAPGAAPASAHMAATTAGSLRDAERFLADVRNAPKFSSSQSCPPRVSGGGALVRSSYRVPPFLADDVLLVEDHSTNTHSRVYCVAYDVYWKERILERKGWLDRDTLSPIMEPGMRVELSPLCPLWIGGAKYGTIQQVTRDWTVVVKMDDPRVRRLQRFIDHTQLTIRESQAENE